MRNGARWLALDCAGNRANVFGRRAAAAADDVDEAGRGEFADRRRHLLWPLVIVAEFVRQSGIGIDANQGVGDMGQFGNVGAHLRSAERAIEPDRHRARMRD